MEQLTESARDTNTIHLVSSNASKITNVNLYSGRAEVTRLFEFEIKAGQNIVTIVGLPRSLQENNVKVEGLGNATIHNVIVGKTEAPPQRSLSAVDSPAEAAIVRSRKEVKNALKSARQSRASLDTYLTTISTVHVDISGIEQALEGHARLCAKVDKQILDLEEKLEEVTTELRKARGQGSDEVYTPSWKVAVSMDGNIGEMVKLSITYAVCSADWTPFYDVRVNTQDKEHAVTIIYKAIITQATGESWENVPLTLGTVTPSFGVQPPTLLPWTVDIYVPPPPPTIPFVQMGIPMSASVPVVIQPSRYARSRSRSPRRRRSRSVSSERLPRYQPTPVMQPPVVIPVSNKGDIVTTFKIPGLITVPDDQGKHNVTVAELTMETLLIWYAIPAVDTMVHLKARIKNESEYTFVPGSANVYVDGSFVATTKLPSVSPQESFDCSLGLDQSIRITYYPLEKKATKSGFVSKNTSRSYTQRITVLNNKSTIVPNLKIIDRVPVSADERIEVKILNPALSIPPAGQSSSSVFRPVPVSQDVFAQWDGADGDFAAEVNDDGTGKNGKFNWVLSIPPQKSVSLALQYDITYPENLSVQGLWTVLKTTPGK